MAASSSSRKSAASARPGVWQSESGTLLAVVGGVVLGLLVLAAVAAAVRWLASNDDPKAPHWLTTDTVRATTSDGQAVRARMALDAPDSDTRAWLSSRPRDLTAVMQISVSHYDGSQGTGARRVQLLADDMEDRLNDVLQASGVPPVRDVVIQDFVISKP